MTFPIVLEGNSLGQRHKQLNALTNEIIASKLPLENIKDAAETCDVERLLKIDVASAQRNVEYILYNLQSDDMLYVSRALKSTWLIKDLQYAHIINPQYLHNQLFPLMINRAICKFKLTIRLHLKDESRCEEFYQYYFDNDDKRQSYLYLPLCSEKFIVDNLKQVIMEIPMNVVKRLVEKTPLIIQEFFKSSTSVYMERDCLDKFRILIKTYTQVYLDLLEHSEITFIKLGKRSTRIILQQYEEKVFQKPELYMHVLHLPTLAKRLGPLKVQELIIKLSNDPKMDHWFSYRAIHPLLTKVNIHDKYKLLQSVFEEREKNKKNRHAELIEELPECCEVRISTQKKVTKRCAKKKCAKIMSIHNVYEWYRYAPFPTAFTKLKKLIRTEAQSDERLAMLKVLIQSTNKNNNFLHQLLQYFTERHINEPINFKMQFIRTLLQSTEVYRYEEANWKILDELFHSLDVYEEGDVQIEDCIEAIILFYILRSQPVPDIILNKWHKNFSNMQSVVDNLKPEEKERVFNFLSLQIKEKISKLPLDNVEDLNKVITLMDNLLDLMLVWKQPIAKQPDLLESLKKIIYKAESLSLLNSITYYGRNKEWNRILFSEALLMKQTEDIFINTLKHNTHLLKKHEVHLQRVMETDDISLDRFLTKVRIYFYNDLAKEWTKKLKDRLNEIRSKHLVRAICILMHRDSFSELLKKYIPQNDKIKWSEENPIELNAKKYFAQQMFLVRPLANVADLIAFAKGDYMQYVLPSLRSVCFQLPAVRIHALLPELLGKNVSAQKHAIRLAFAKLFPTEFQTLVLKHWEQTNNASIRALLYKHIFEMLCQQKTDEDVCKVWDILKMLTNRLTTEEDRSIYAILGKTDNVPKKILPEFCIVSYRYLKTVPKKMNCEQHVYSIYDAMRGIVDELDEDFVNEILQQFLESVFIEKDLFKDYNIYNSSLCYIFRKVLLCCKTESEQIGKYEQFGKPFVKYIKDLWYTRKETTYRARVMFENFVEELSQDSKSMIFIKDCKYVTPIVLFNRLCHDVEEFNNHIHININLHLMVAALEIFHRLMLEKVDDIPDDNDGFQQFLLKELSLHFGKKCGALLDQYLIEFNPSFLSIFIDIITNFINSYLGYSDYREEGLFKILMADSLISNTDNIYNVLLGIHLFPSNCSYFGEEIEAEFTRVYKNLQTIEDKDVQVHLLHHMPFSEKFN